MARTPPGHFYSPYASPADLRAKAATLFADQDVFAGIDLRPEHQLDLLARFDELAADFLWTAQPQDGLRYYYANRPYAYGDGLFTAAMLRMLTPARYIEVGSGFSTLLALDVRERWNPEMEITTIDPYPARLSELLGSERPDNFSVIEQPVQEIDPGVFETLRSNDVLLIDSTHVAKAGSDVNHLIFEILPTLAPGVKIHIHDVFATFDYPREWLLQGRAWSEAYLLRAFLQFNTAFDVEFWGHWLHTHHRDRFGPNLAPAHTNPGASLWISRNDTAAPGARTAG